MAYCLRSFAGFATQPPWFEISAEDQGLLDLIPYVHDISSMTAGIRIDETTMPKPSWLPTQAVCTSRHKALPDTFYLADFCCVSQRFKEIIESFDPGIHQFFPVTIRSKNGLFREIVSYLFNVCAVENTIEPEASGFVQTQVKDLYMILNKKERFLKDISQKTHVWREKVYLRELYMSEKLFDAATAVGVKSIKDKYVLIKTKILHS